MLCGGARSISRQTGKKGFQSDIFTERLYYSIYFGFCKVVYGVGKKWGLSGSLFVIFNGCNLIDPDKGIW